MKNNLLYIFVGVIVLAFAAFQYQKFRVPPKIEFTELTLTDLNGNSKSLQEFAGKNIFITMWAPWCKDCLEEMPALQYVKNQLKNDDFVFLAISGYNIDKEKVFADKMPYDFEYLHMSEKLKEIGVHAIPTNYIINKKGKVVYEKVGAEKNWKSPETIERVKALAE